MKAGLSSEDVPRRYRTSAVRKCVERIRLYGWDSRSQTWHGPNELGQLNGPDKRLLQALQTVPGRSWYGPISCRAPRGMRNRFFALVHDLFDCCIVSIYCAESKTGPAEIVAVIPADRRSRLRDDFAFEFLTFARFLGSLNVGAELLVHDAINTALAAPCGSETLIFSISSGLWPCDLDHVLSYCVQKVAVTLCQWLRDSSASDWRPGADDPGQSVVFG